MSEESKRAPRSCPACGSDRSRWAFTTRGYPHVRCLACDSLYVSPLPTEAEIRAVYEDAGYHAGVEESEERMRREARARAEILRQRGCRHVLELGSGAGYFLEACEEAGMRAEGVDAGPTGALAESRGLTIHRTWIDDFEPSEQYDAVAMFELLEHLPEPVTLLERVHGWTREGGTLALSTPSSTGIPARALGRRFPLITPPEHLELFSHQGLGTLVTRGGFQPFRWTSFSNLDAEKLDNGFRRYLRGSSKPAGWLARVLGVAAAAPVRWIDRMGFGISFEMYAEPFR